MKLAEPARHAGLGALAGALVAGLFVAFNLAPVFGSPHTTALLTIGLFVGALIGLFQFERWLYVPVAILLVLHFIVAESVLMRRISEHWVRNDGPPPVGLDAIVVLSAYMQPDSAIDADGTERLLSGLELFRGGIAPRIVTSRVVVDESGRRWTSTADQKRLLALAGVDPSTQWIEVDSVHSTRDEAVRMAAKLAPLGATRIALVTSPFHTRRACATFEAVGFRVSCFPARERRTQTYPPPHPPGRLAAFGDYVYERLGMIKYRWKGWIR